MAVRHETRVSSLNEYFNNSLKITGIGRQRFYDSFTEIQIKYQLINLYVT